MTAIVAANFDCSIESCDKAPRDLNYERNTEKYGRAMKLTITLRERLHTHKVVTKDHWFYHYYLKLSIKSYVVDVIRIASPRRF